MSKKSEAIRCYWASQGDALEQKYHDKEWGVPVYNDRKLFEFLILEGAQAGLSWRTILHKRPSYRAAFDNFDAKKIARYGAVKKRLLLKNEGIIRNRLKIDAAITNAAAFLEVKNQYSSFSNFIWQFVDGNPIQYSRKRHKDIPAQTKESILMSKELKRLGFRFVGPTICYAFMQAVGMVNDHTVDCFRHAQVKLRK